MKPQRTRKWPGWILPVLISMLIVAGYIFFDNYNKQLHLRDELIGLDAALAELYQLRTLQSDAESEELFYALTRDRLFLNSNNTEKSQLLESLDQYREKNRFLLSQAGLPGFGAAVTDWLAQPGPGWQSYGNRPDSGEQQNRKLVARNAWREESNTLEKFLKNKRDRSGQLMQKLTRQNSAGYILLLVFTVFLLALAFRLNALQLKAQYQAELARKDEDIRAAFAYAYIGKALVSADGRYVLVNRSFCKMLGYSESELTRMHFQDITCADDLPGVLQQVNMIREKKIDSFEMEKRYIAKNGELIWTLLSVSAVWNEDGSFRYFISQVKDITQEKKIRQQLADSNEELEQFAYTASHDMKEPLRMIGSFMGLLQKNYGDKLDDTARKYIYFATDGANRMNKLINDLLEYSRAGRTGSTPGLFRLDELLLDITQFNKAVMENRQAIIRWSDMPELFFSRTALQQVLQNLIGNALKYQDGRQQPRVEISATDRNTHWEFAVRDNGIGFDPAYKEKIFTLFQRLHGKSEYPGSGIGLATSKKILERAGGKIWCESGPGQGSVFYFTLPKQNPG